MQDFKRNLRRTNGNSDFKASMLEEVYHAIRYHYSTTLKSPLPLESFEGQNISPCNSREIDQIANFLAASGLRSVGLNNYY